MNFDPTITIGGLFTLLATLGLYLYQWLDKGRVRRWQNEDAAEVAADLKQAAAKIASDVAAKLAADAATADREARERSTVLASTVIENITTTAAAIKQSNAFNEKFARVDKKMLAMERAHRKKRTRK